MSVERNRLRSSDLLIASGSIALLASMFLFAWFAIRVPGVFGAYISAAGVDTSVDAWSSLETIRWLLLGTALTGFALVLHGALGRSRTIVPGLAVLVVMLGAASTLLVFYRTVVSEPLGHADVKLGAWLGLASCVAIAYGGVRALLARGAVSQVARAVESSP